MAQDNGLKAIVVPVTPFQQNCSIIWCTQTMRGAVIDPGGETDRLLAAAKQHNVEIERILVTHGHMDHAGATAELAEKLRIPVDGPEEEDQFWIDKITESGAAYGMTYCRPFKPTRWLKDGDTVTVGRQTLQVIHCPGHTPGHVVFFHEPSRFAIVGDVIFKGSIGRTDFPRGDHEALIRSITEKLWPLGHDVAFLPGHGPTSTFGIERKTNPFVADAVLAR